MAVSTARLMVKTMAMMTLTALVALLRAAGILVGEMTRQAMTAVILPPDQRTLGTTPTIRLKAMLPPRGELSPPLQDSRAAFV